MSIQMSINHNKNSLILCLPKPTEIILVCDQTYWCNCFLRTAVWLRGQSPGVSNSLYLTVTLPFPVIHQQFIFGC